MPDVRRGSVQRPTGLLRERCIRCDGLLRPGSNAIRDAALLDRRLSAIAQAREDLATALASYRGEMRGYGFVGSARMVNVDSMARVPIDRARAALPGQVLEDVFTVGTDARKVFLGLGPVISPVPPDQAARVARELAPALAGYEEEMARYFFDVERASALMGRRVVGQAPLPA